MPCILVIDDENIMRTALRQVLKDAGYDVIEAFNGTEGVERFRDNPVDLVITDMMLPEKGGLELIKELREEDPEVKIIAISALAYDAFSAAKEQGASAAFEKPIHMQELLNTVARLLGEMP